MGLNDAIEKSMDGIRASRLQMELIASNIANAQTTRSKDGGPYQRRVAVFEEVPFESHLRHAEKKPVGALRLAEIKRDIMPGEVVYNPNHPDADANGFVQMPNVSVVQEMTDLSWVSQLYNINVQAYNASRRMGQDALRLLE